MGDLKICRICLIQDVKMYKYVMNYYEEIINKKVADNDGVPQWFCIECATMLQKFQYFKQKCVRGLSLLKELLEKGPLSSDDVYQIDREINGLKSPIQETSDLNVKIKTYVFKYKKLSRINSPTSNIKINQKEKFENTRKCTEKRNALVLERIRTDKINNPIEIEKMYPNENDGLINFNDETFCEDDDGISDRVDSEILNYSEPDSDKIFVNGNHKLNTESMKLIYKSTISEANMFKRSIKKKFLNPNHWKRLNLTDEEAEKEFRAKQVNQKYSKASFKCSDCFRGFSQEEMLNRHLKIKHCKSLGSLECRFCHIRVKWKSRLQKHIKEHYTRYKCLRCELSFSVEETAFKHDEFHNGVTRTCPHCGEQFRHSSSFYTHLRKHRSKYVCTLCGISFLSEFGLYMHKKVKHILINTEAAKTEKNMFCEVCNIKFVTQEAYEEHLAQSALHTIVTGKDDCTPQPLKRRYTQRRAPRKYTSCSTCGQNFSTYVAYSKHHLAEHPDVPLAATPYRPNVRKICEICGVSVAPVSLVAHINTHTREKRYTCSICGAHLSSKSGLNRHRLTHTSDKPKKCSLCDKSFARTTNMKLHYRTVHNNMKETSLRK